MELLILLAVIFLAYSALPGAWGVRAWVATGIWVLWVHALVPELPSDAHAPLDGLVTVGLLWLFVLASLGVGVRVFWDLATERSLQLSPPADSMIYRTDCLIAALLGLAAGTVATLLLAVGMRGAASGLKLHLGVAATAALLAVASCLLHGRVRPLAVAAFAILAILTLAGGTVYPSLIQSKAEIIQSGAPRCIRTPDGTAPAIDQLRLLTLPMAQPRRPNLVLTVMTERGQEDFRWSYRSFAFRSYGSYSGGPCPT